MPHVNYWMNKDYIASVLCENKDRPELECNGKCHLKKEIQSNSDDQNNGQEVASSMMVEFFQPSERFEFKCTPVSNSDVFCDYCEPVESGFISSVFHPPQV